MSMAKLIQRTKTVINEAHNEVRQAFRGVLNRIDSSRGIQSAQVSGLAGEVIQDVEHIQQFGFTSHPPAGTEAIILPLGGASSHAIVIGTEHSSYRIQALDSGEVAIYNQSGASITLKNGKIIEIDCEQLNIQAAAGVRIDTPNVQCSQQLTAAGQINGNGGMAIQGGTGARFCGNIRQNDGSYTTTGDVTAGSISLKQHDHASGVGAPC